MRCYICDTALADDEVRFNRNHQTWDPCGTCKEVIRKAVNESGDPDEVDEGYDDDSSLTEGERELVENI